MNERKKLCGDPVREALLAIGRWPVKCAPAPSDFTEEERFKMFRQIMHENVWPAADIIGRCGRTACSWSYCVASWHHGGRREFSSRVQEAAHAELEAVDYAIYDLAQIRCLIGDDGKRFCRLLKTVDAAEMAQRMNGVEADLAVIDRKLISFQRNREAFGELRYRIDLYDSSYEAVIRGGRGGWLWTALAP